MRYILLISIIIAFSACSSKDDYILFNQENLSSESRTTTLKNVDFEYKILPHDRLSIIIYKHPELSSVNPTYAQTERGLLIDSKGDIRLPLINKIHLAGLTQPEAEEKLSNAYRVYLKKPDIHIEVINKRAYVIGEVKRPGEITLENEQLPLLQILARAGDLTDHANRKSILVMRRDGNSKVTSQIINLTSANSIISANLMIKPNDIVYVMPNGMKAFNNKVNEIAPVFRLISNILQPFVNIKFLSN
jgi:polysaccharide export outer membrane protein